MKEAYNGKSKNRKGNKVKPKVMDENTISSQISPKISDKEPEVDDKNDYDYQEPDNKRHSAYSSRKTENNNINNSGQKKVKNDAWVPVLTADGPLNDPPDEAVEVEDLLDYKPKGRKVIIHFYLGFLSCTVERRLGGFLGAKGMSICCIIFLITFQW